MAKELKVNLLHALENYLNMYTHEPQEILVIESIANSLDIGAQDIDIKVYSKSGEFYYSILDNGAGMNEETFESYHTIALSTKNKGQSIGFAGVGAKIYLAAWDGSEIVTETHNSKKALASRMFRNRDQLLYDNVKPAISRHGTRYTVKLSREHYDKLKKEIEEYIAYWFNYVSPKVHIHVNGNRFKPWKPDSTKSTSGVYKTQRSEFPYSFFLTESELPEERRNVEYVCFGKRIMVDSPDWDWQVDKEYHNRYYAVVVVDRLALFLTSNKESFQRNWFANRALFDAKARFFSWLKDNGLINVEEGRTDLQQKAITNILTEQLDRLLSQANWKWLNPWFRPHIRDVLVPDGSGTEKGVDTEGSQKVPGSKNGKKGNGGVPISGEKPGSGVSPSDAGESATVAKRKATGMQIIPVDHPDDPREGYVDPENKGIVINFGHTLARKIASKRSDYLMQYNTCRVVVNSLVSYSAQTKEMSAEEALETTAKIIGELDLWQ